MATRALSGQLSAPALWLGIGLLIAAFAAVAVLVAPGEIGRPKLPPELAQEPDLYIAEGVITQHRVDGGIRYRLRARRITHFATAREVGGEQVAAAGETRLVAPEIELPGAPAPWHARADTALAFNTPEQDEVLRPPEEAPRIQEETMHLEGDVELAQTRPDGGFTRLSTESLTLLPDSRSARTDQPVMIVTEGSRMSAAGLTADLESGRMRLFSSTKKRVRVVVQPSQTVGANREP